jgi:mRNA interferase RelE/StbE
MLDVSRHARDFLESLPPKQYRQVARRIFGLSENQHPNDSEHVSGNPGYFRVTQGEYRIIYRVATASPATVIVVDVGKRNDDQVYRDLKRRT